jgi:dTDP-4-amino-4,6-dideoxygalactose transaminase
MEIPFLDLGPQHQMLREPIMQAWGEILGSTRFVSSRSVAEFEEAFAQAHEVEHCVAVSSGTEALVLILRALDVGSGDKVVLPANTFIATAEAASLVGATPVLVDCDRDTKNIDPTQAVATATAGGAKAIIGVHLYGQPADIDALDAGAGVHVIEDAAQAHLATYRGRPVGGIGQAAGFSFYPGKNLGAPGEGGAVTTHDDALAAELRMLRAHGETRKYESRVVGTNARMMELVAATLAIKLPYLADWTAARRQVAAWYAERLGDDPSIELPTHPDHVEPVYHLYVVHVPHRDEVAAMLNDAGVSTGMHYPIPIHLQDAYRHLGHGPGDFPNTEYSAAHLLSLPMFPELTETQVDYVCEMLRDAVAACTRGDDRL